ncbi:MULTISPECIES: membrane protein insertion efficiency factor YidD [Corynebacterium]|uniref:Putative membrane protein insertion efficiency factor n=2 Tax=Corynebacterium glucuronolyticum TaxID=39791 RepID=A0A7T4JVE9_9CORY|nr:MULTISPECIES: membrane protein insertion efficiency factor YidD [Corynebacterium]MDU3077638.1 membrane protein insertion efficiency factor YidD [Mixta calida]EEI27671.1 conserved hypothetical protein YidD [Corynebacterium glucuronolyticum ATCC 51867]EEI63897.1 conserved hypothetical protein YidD [Corynebacterium glucuronolyticum ATCC 51866]MCT1442994.1 membrane protein insertion efficiency factor YidD [Corynebacterium glucuronolyticum]MCT1563258.1 membrane protein insertion efficiency facto
MGNSKPGVAERAILFYQAHISALKPYSTCRFDPVCSQYALDAIRKKGTVVGIIMALVRIAKCGPWHPGGYDPV